MECNISMLSTKCKSVSTVKATKSSVQLISVVSRVDTNVSGGSVATCSTVMYSVICYYIDNNILLHCTDMQLPILKYVVWKIDWQMKIWWRLK